MLSRVLSRTNKGSTLAKAVPHQWLPQRTFVDMAIALPAIMVGSASLVGFACYRYKVSNPNQYLVRTGLGITDIKISKQGFQFPFQRCKFISMGPRDYIFDLYAMSNEKISFVLSGAFVIAPKNNKEALIKYLLYIEDSDLETQRLVILDILEGELRSLATTLTMGEISANHETFKEKVMANIQAGLDTVGLHIIYANIKELRDGPNSQYFVNMCQKKESEAKMPCDVI